MHLSASERLHRRSTLCPARHATSPITTTHYLHGPSTAQCLRLMVHIQVLLMPELIISMAPAVTFDIFPDEVLQEIFASCLCNRHWNPMGHMKEWQRLVHVCQKWQQIIYRSPSFFDLHLYCSTETPFRDNLSHVADDFGYVCLDKGKES